MNGEVPSVTLEVAHPAVEKHNTAHRWRYQTHSNCQDPASQISHQRGSPMCRSRLRLNSQIERVKSDVRIPVQNDVGRARIDRLKGELPILDSAAAGSGELLGRPAVAIIVEGVQQRNLPRHNRSGGGHTRRLSKRASVPVLNEAAVRPIERFSAGSPSSWTIFKSTSFA